MTSKNLAKSTKATAAAFLKPKTSDGTKNLFLFLRITGILMTDKFKSLYMIYSLIYNFVTIVLVPLMFIMSYFMASEKMQINQLLTSMQTCMAVCTCVIKFSIIIYMRRCLFKCEAILDKLDARIQHPEEIREAQKAVRYGNRIVIVYTICYISFSTITFLVAFSVGRPPYSLYIPNLNWRESLFNRIVACAIEFMLTHAVIAQSIPNDTFAVIYIGILDTHLRILIMRVLRIGTDPSCSHESSRNELVQCVHDHRNITELLNTIGPVISATYFIQFLTTTASLGATLLNISISNTDPAVILSAAFGLCLILEILPICYLADTLAADGHHLSEAIFHMNWVDQSLEFRRLCLFFMHRSQQTYAIYAGKIFKISLNTFVVIVKYSFSVYTLLNNMGVAEKFK